MDDLLVKIKETENEAKKIVKDAEQQAMHILDKANAEARKKTEEAKKRINLEFLKNKQEKIKETEEEKSKIVKEKMNDFINNFGKIDLKKKKTTEYLLKRIKEILE